MKMECQGGLLLLLSRACRLALRTNTHSRADQLSPVLSLIALAFFPPRWAAAALREASQSAAASGGRRVLPAPETFMQKPD